MNNHIETMEKELSELVEKKLKLGLFAASADFKELDDSERLNIMQQLWLMVGYSDVLELRIENAKREPVTIGSL